MSLVLFPVSHVCAFSPFENVTCSFLKITDHVAGGTPATAQQGGGRCGAGPQGGHVEAQGSDLGGGEGDAVCWERFHGRSPCRRAKGPVAPSGCMRQVLVALLLLCPHC